MDLQLIANKVNKKCTKMTARKIKYIFISDQPINSGQLIIKLVILTSLVAE